MDRWTEGWVMAYARLLASGSGYRKSEYEPPRHPLRLSHVGCNTLHAPFAFTVVDTDLSQAQKANLLDIRGGTLTR